MQMKLQQFNYNDGGSLMPQVSPKLDSALSHLFSSLPSSAVSADDFQVRALPTTSANCAGSHSGLCHSHMHNSAHTCPCDRFACAGSALRVLPDADVVERAVQPHYPKMLLAAIVLEVLGGLLFALGSTIGAYMLVRHAPLQPVTCALWSQPRVAPMEQQSFIRI